jgi:SecD/SecF fusion protein
VTDRRRNLLILLLVAGLLAGSVAAIFAKKARLGLDLKGGVQLVYQTKPSAAQPVVTDDAKQRAVDIMRKRVDQVLSGGTGTSESEVSLSGKDQITASLPGVPDAARAVKLLGTPAQLAFYDWESNLLGPNGKPYANGVSPGLLATDQAAAQATQAAGDVSGGVPLYDAVKAAAKRPKQGGNASRIDPQFWLFDKGSDHKLLAGPDDNQKDLLSSLRGGTQPPNSQILVVQPGTVVLQAVDQNSKKPVSPDDPAARFYVLNDNVSLFGKDVKDPKQETDSQAAGSPPNVTFKFTGKGKKEFHDVTRTISQRGQQLQNPTSTGGQPLTQHFAVALDRKLITVATINPQDLPDGIDGEQGAQITGSFTIESAQDLANLLKLGALPVNLKLISQSQVSATLGKEALHQGLIAGIVGLGVVILFLLLFYRVLGLIATLGLIIYAFYFYALLKLTNSTFTLPGIAGLILTIGVAADANIVIFERVKEEIRAGRSIPAGIAVGYKKGFSAILDANVVTIMTAFILFILATAGVKGFAFTLGIGTIVSLFTAVMATQAILGAMGRSRLISRPSALGAGSQGRRWSFDFMGASKWFFSLSGVILLIGALAIGGRGLKFGIDFESGTRITTAVAKQGTTENDVRSVLASSGYGDAKIQKLSDKSLGPTAFQISTRTLQPDKVASVNQQLDKRFGVPQGKFSSESVGPTFGQTVANSAVIAIIASLLVISAYIALRFEWKFAVPVLIALMHDLLITAGVYSLIGREVTTATVAALLTILGYSLYDTIIVFDRVRENVPRMPRAAFSQIVNRSMSEVITRSAATTLCTLLPVIALLLFGGETLGDFAFALLIGVASGAYSSIFIASPVLTHWKEREAVYTSRRHRLEDENNGTVPAYATGAAGQEVEPKGPRRPSGRLTAPEPEQLSPSEFEALKRNLEVDDAPRRSTATATPRQARAPRTSPPGARKAAPPEPRSADDVAENDGMSPTPKPRKPAKPRNRRHGRPR